MKRPLAIVTTTILIILFIYACGSTIRTANTSFVTVTIGGTAITAVLKAEAATPWLRIKYFFADAKLMPEAYAYIPSVVQSIVVTVTAQDISMPVSYSISIKPTDTVATIRIEVPNGNNRLFTVEGIRGVNGQIYYRGTAAANLNGADITLPVTMNFVGPGIWVDGSQPLTANTLTCGATPATACATITYALNTRTSGTDAIIVSAGTYSEGGAAPRESYPLRLKRSNALICIGSGQSTVISASTGTGVITSADGASIDNCRIIGPSATGYTGINEVAPLSRGTTINNVTMEMPYNTFGTIIGIALYSDSPIIESAVTFTGAPIVNPMIGIQVNSGKPTIQASLVRGLGTGITLGTGAGAAFVTGTTISGNTTGISLGNTGQPTVTLSQITNNATGILVSNGNPTISSNTIRNNTNNGLSITGSASGQITDNVIDHNNTGLLITVATGGDPRVNFNSIFCNSFTGADVTSLSATHLENNSWNRDTTTVPSGPRVDTGNCLAGADICPRSGTPMPIYTPFSAAVSGGCP